MGERVGVGIYSYGSQNVMQIFPDECYPRETPRAPMAAEF